MSREDVLLLFKELLSSLRDTNRRIDELQWIVKSDLFHPDKKPEIINRIKRLMETKFCIICSIYDIRLRLIDCFSWDITEYEEIQEAFKIEGLYNRLNGG